MALEARYVCRKCGAEQTVQGINGQPHFRRRLCTCGTPMSISETDKKINKPPRAKVKASKAKLDKKKAKEKKAKKKGI